MQKIGLVCLMPIVFEEVFYERFQFTLHTNVHPYTHPGNLHLSCIKVPNPVINPLQQRTS